MRVLVTGGAGFIGSRLCDRLLGDGHRVVALDSFVTGRRANLAQHARHPRFELVEGDVTSPLSCEVDRIYNLACPASPAHYQRDAVETVKTCVLGALRCLELAARTGARVLQASTSEVYGDPLVHPQPEGYFGNVNPLGPRACYDEGKRCAETLTEAFHGRGVSVRIARIFNTYGPRLSPDDGRVVSNFIVQALRGEALTVYGDGAQTRSFCYFDDLITGLLALMEHPRYDGPINLGSPVEHSVRALADEVLRQVGGPSRVVHLPLPQDDPRLRNPDLALARNLLGFSPATSLREGLARTIASYQDGC